jgi:chromosome segregation ATPase
MDTLQTARMIEWLDEERRRDKAMLAQLEERNRQQQELIDQLKRQLNGLENDLSTMRAQYMPANRDQELMQLLRNEFNQIIEGLEAKRLTAEREAERRQEIMRETLMTPVRKLEDQQDRTTEAMRDIIGIRTERDRMAAAIAAMQQRVEDVAKKIEEPERRLLLVEEQRRQDARRLSDVQSAIPDLSKSIEQVGLKVDLIEGLTKSNEKRIIELQTGESNRREEIQIFLDQQNLISQQREQQVSDIRQRVTAYDDDMRRNIERFEAWSETHRQMRKVVDDFDRISERLERRINEVAEMQRLAEERFRTEWNDWTSDDQHRWKEFTVSNDESWRQHNKEISELRLLLRETAERLDPLYRSLDRVWKLQRAQAELYRERYQALLLEYDKPQEMVNALGEVLLEGNNGNYGRP